MCNVTNVCCLCSLEHDNLQIIDNGLFEKIVYCICEFNEIPKCITKYICQQCSNKLEISIEFKKMCSINIKKAISELKPDSDDGSPYINCIEFCNIKQEIVEDESIKNSFDLKSDMDGIHTLLSQEEVLNGSGCVESGIKDDGMVGLRRKTSEGDVTNRHFCTNCDMKGVLLSNSVLSPFICTNCGKDMITSSAPRCDKRGPRVKYRPLLCPKCGKFFKTKDHLTKHMRYHADDRPFTCLICGKCFKSKPNLDTHSTTHLTRRPHTCNICGKSFKKKGNLTLHLVIHTDKRPHRCETCNRSFYKKDHLVRHKRSHSNERPFPCEFCEKAFFTKQHVTRHVATMHPTQNNNT